MLISDTVVEALIWASWAFGECWFGWIIRQRVMHCSSRVPEDKDCWCNFGRNLDRLLPVSMYVVAFAYRYTWNREIVFNSQKLVKRRPKLAAWGAVLGYFLTNEGQDTRISGAQPERGLCWKGGNRKERESVTRKNVCVTERKKRPRILAPLAGIWNDREKWSYICDLKIAVFSIVPWKFCCSIELINV